METDNNLRKGTKVGLIIGMALTILVIVNTIVSTMISTNRAEPFVLLHWITDAAIALLVVLYATIGYKKPHGNMLKVVFFAFAIYILSNSIIPSAELNGAREIIVRSLAGLAAVFVTYIGGRLDRIAKNRLLMVFVGVLLLASRTIVLLAFPSNLFRFLGVYTQPIIWAAIGFAYTACYEGHKAAGLEDR